MTDNVRFVVVANLRRLRRMKRTTTTTATTTNATTTATTTPTWTLIVGPDPLDDSRSPIHNTHYYLTVSVNVS